MGSIEALQVNRRAENGKAGGWDPMKDDVAGADGGWSEDNVARC